jgi:hypothetical protein
MPGSLIDALTALRGFVQNHHSGHLDETAQLELAHLNAAAVAAYQQSGLPLPVLPPQRLDPLSGPTGLMIARSLGSVGIVQDPRWLPRMAALIAQAQALSAPEPAPKQPTGPRRKRGRPQDTNPREDRRIFDNGPPES